MTGAGRRDGASAAAYWPALDGMRAIAIALVVAYHLGYLPGGWLGVDCFFVLSGYLITTLLLVERHATGGTAFRAFWGRRARRLLPAVLLLLVFVSGYAWAGGPGLVGAQLRGPLLATLLYSANWQQIASGHSYFAQFVGPSPLAHSWSLAIEEQYYLLWPLLLVALLALVGRSRRALVIAIGALMAASAAWMGIAYHLFGANRAYLGTDSRAWELLLGGLVAVVWRAGDASRHEQSWSGALLLGVAGCVVAVRYGGGPPGWMWRGGMVGAAVCMAVVIVGSVRAPRSVITRVLAIRPMVWLGLISYSLYLWHWPAIVLLSGTTTGLDGAALLAARIAAMTAAACTSYYVVERPLRRADWSSWPRLALAPTAMAATAAMVIAATVAPAQAIAAPTQAIAAAPMAAASGPSANSSSATTTSTSPQVESVLASARFQSAADPLRVWILGDSVMNDGSLGLAAALEATGRAKVVMNDAIPGWGLSVHPSWPADALQIVDRYHPEVVIGTWSWDNNVALHDPAGYTEQLRQWMRLLLSPRGGITLIVLLELPQIGPPSQITDPARQQATWLASITGQAAWDRTADAATQSVPGHAVYVPTSSVFAPAGSFLTWHHTPSGAWIRARKLDNTHICPYGAAELGALVVGDVGSALHLGPMRTGWEAGAWVHDPRYNDPPGTCPADQPPAGYRGIPVPAVAP